jgi:dephospho-CoA kinase
MKRVVKKKRVKIEIYIKCNRLQYIKINEYYKIMAKYDYLKKYIDYTYHQHYPKLRELLHERIIDSYFENKNFYKTNNKIIFTAGCYGAGKSHLLKYMHNKQKIDIDEYIHIDQDKIRQYIPEYTQYLQENQFTAGYRTNKETGYISELIQRHALHNNYNLIVDSSLQDAEWHMEYFNWIKNTFPNYKIIIIFVNVSWVTILERNILRSEQTKRCIPLNTLKNIYQHSEKSFDKLKLVVDAAYNIYNDDIYYAHENIQSMSDQIEKINLN